MMIRKVRKIAILTILAAASISPIASYAKGWESVKTERTNTRTVIKEAEVEIKAAKGEISVTTSRTVQVKIFTILGQLVSNESVPPGTYRLTISSHGVYIVKIGDLTCKVAV